MTHKGHPSTSRNDDNVTSLCQLLNSDSCARFVPNSSQYFWPTCKIEWNCVKKLKQLYTDPKFWITVTLEIRRGSSSTTWKQRGRVRSGIPRSLRAPRRLAWANLVWKSCSLFFWCKGDSVQWFRTSWADCKCLVLQISAPEAEQQGSKGHLLRGLRAGKSVSTCIDILWKILVCSYLVNI